jgi:hypothetical protein
MPFEKPLRCPLCDGHWLPTFADDHFTCDNWETCGLLFLAKDASYYIKKICPDGTEVWWCYNGPCEIRRPMGGFFKINFNPPFDITPEQLKLYLVFS